MSATDYLPSNLSPEARQLSLLAIAKQNRKRYEELKSSPVIAAALGFTPDMFELVDAQLAAGDAEDAAKEKAKWYLEPQVAAALRKECLNGTLDACKVLFKSVGDSPCSKNPVVDPLLKRIRREEGAKADALRLPTDTQPQAQAKKRAGELALFHRAIREVYDPYCASQYAPKPTPKNIVAPGQALEAEKSNIMLYVLLGAAAIGGWYFYSRRK